MEKSIKAIVEQTLINDESMTDDEMLDYFINELNIPKDIAKKCLSQRGKAMGDSEFKLKTT